ncbi:MAG TPA: cysteine hydrolase [Acidimicrobiales bacterium]|nr:cysteine hydrolase [Acidimicrobiales bacterium]
MPVELTDLLQPRHTAVLTMEIQRGVVGDLSSFPELAGAASSSGMLHAVGRLLAAVRPAGVTVVHCTAGFRADREGSPANAPLITAMLRRSEHLLEGTPAVELVPEIGAAADDLVSHRRHGVSPFGGTGLDEMLRGRAIETVVATGVSLNLGIIGLCVEAVNLGYRVVLPTDAVTGIPAGYGADVLRHTLALVATLTTVDEIVAALGS